MAKRKGPATYTNLMSHTLKDQESKEPKRIPALVVMIRSRCTGIPIEVEESDSEIEDSLYFSNLEVTTSQVFKDLQKKGIPIQSHEEIVN